MLDTQMPTNSFRFPREPSPQERFIQQCQSFLAATTAIDRDTPWQQTEPDWWLKMMAMQSLAREACSDTSHPRQAY